MYILSVYKYLQGVESLLILTVYSSKTTTLSSSHAPASCGPQFPSDPPRFSYQRCHRCISRDDAGQPSPDMSGQWLLAVVLSLVGQDHRNVVVGGRCQVMSL